MKKAKQRNVLTIPVSFNYRFGDKVYAVVLTNGKSISFHSHRRTDEGYQSEKEVITLRDRVLKLRWWSDGRDCDGRLTQEGRSCCPVHRRASVRHRKYGNEKPARDRFPKWEEGERSQRDESAERMGY